MTWSRNPVRFCAGFAGALSLLGVLLLAGCGGGDVADVGVAEAADESGGAVVMAELGEYSMSLDDATVKAGDVKFVIKNAGAIEHEFVILRTDLAADALPVAEGEVEEDAVPQGADGEGSADEQASDEESGEEQLMEVEDIASGATATLNVNLEPGKYVVICNLTGHYADGMRAPLTVG